MAETPSGTDPASSDPYSCDRLPSLLSKFADTFVDFVVGGQFLGSGSNSNSYHRNHSNVAEGGAAAENGDSKTWADTVTRLPPADRVVAIGDIHGDLHKARQVLMSANVMDANDNWIAGKTAVIQVGDLLDRGDEELKVIYLMERLKRQAEKAGGNLVVLNGNHEIMNMEGNFRYATPVGMEEFRQWAKWYAVGQQMKMGSDDGGKSSDIYNEIPETAPEAWRARRAALRPGGPISSRFLANNPTVAVVGSSVFVHGGLLPLHVEYGLEKMNEQVRDWILGRSGRRAPDFVRGRDAVVWLRRYSDTRTASDCRGLEQVLNSIPGADRMVVGHTIQTTGINGACGNRVVRVDVGMSKGCIDGMPEALEIRQDKELRVLTTNPVFQPKPKVAESSQEKKTELRHLSPERGKTPEIQVNA